MFEAAQHGSKSMVVTVSRLSHQAYVCKECWWQCCSKHAAGLPGIEPVVLTASLKHHFEAVGGNIVQITFEDTEIKVTGGIGGLLVSPCSLHYMQTIPCSFDIVTSVQHSRLLCVLWIDF